MKKLFAIAIALLSFHALANASKGSLSNVPHASKRPMQNPPCPVPLGSTPHSPPGSKVPGNQSYPPASKANNHHEAEASMMGWGNGGNDKKKPD